MPEPYYRGKVRDIHDLGDQLLMVASDRISAFDVVFRETIPGKGAILTGISNHWFGLLKDVKNHLVETECHSFPEPFNGFCSELQGRSVLVRKAQRIDFECVVRACLMGSGFKEYKSTGAVCGEKLPPGLKQGARLARPIFTPATKNDTGHDKNISFAGMKDRIGSELAEELRRLSLQLFESASEKLKQQGIMLLDTKLEFGLLNGEIILIDEIFTPDSSRFCDAVEYEQAMTEHRLPPSLDKQVLRNYLETLDWDRNPPAPELPEHILRETERIYRQIEKKVLCIT